MAELMVRGSGRPPAAGTGPLAAQAAWIAHRRRKVAARVALGSRGRRRCGGFPEREAGHARAAEAETGRCRMGVVLVVGVTGNIGVAGSQGSL
jgi:hypothetical protein